MHSLWILQIINVGNEEIVYTLTSIEILFIYLFHCLNIRVECKFNLIIIDLRLAIDPPQKEFCTL